MEYWVKHQSGNNSTVHINFLLHGCYPWATSVDPEHRLDPTSLNLHWLPMGVMAKCDMFTS
jgi:hypothetical protein